MAHVLPRASKCRPSHLPLASILDPRALPTCVPRLLADVARLPRAALVLLLLAPERELLLLLLLAVGHLCGYKLVAVGTRRSAAKPFLLHHDECSTDCDGGAMVVRSFTPTARSVTRKG